MNDISSERPASQATCSSPTGQAPSDLAATRHDQAQGILALAARCEAATGPDRELDALIWCALRPGVKYRGHWDVSGPGNGHLTQVEYTEPPRRTRMVSNSPYVPHAQNVTASLDAAMTLVPEGAHWRIEDHPSYGISALVADEQSYAAIPALALCAAALRARASR